MRLSYHPEAERELLFYITFYEKKTEGLGSEFLLEVERALNLIKTFPDSGSFISENERRVLLKRFDFGIIYTIYEEQIKIYALMHLKRKPGYWKYRK